MELTHTFTVPAPVETTWKAFNDLEMVAGCFPGATLASVDGNDFKGSCKVKLGPISLVYSGTGSFVQRDEATRRFVIEALGKDKRGNGTAGATVIAVLTGAEGDDGSASTSVEVSTDLSITGKPAQFGRGVIQDVSDKLLRQFVTCLETKVGEQQPGSGAATLTTSAPETASATPDSTHPELPPESILPESSQAGSASRESQQDVAEQVPPVATAQPTAATDSRPSEEDALDLGATVIPVLLRAYGKQIAALVVALIVVWKLLSRRSR